MPAEAPLLVVCFSILSSYNNLVCTGTISAITCPCELDSNFNKAIRSRVVCKEWTRFLVSLLWFSLVGSTESDLRDLLIATRSADVVIGFLFLHLKIFPPPHPQPLLSTFIACAECI